jgi:protein-S-isoprenylcysteine O-methyltransferase Ste14
MSDSFAHNSIWKTSDAIFGITFLLGLALHFVPSLNLTFPISARLRMVAGVVLVLAGVTAIVLAKRGLKNAGQPAAPGKPTTQVVETGIYRFSRNPLYLGLVAVLAGMGLSVNVAWWAILALPMFFALQHLLIIPEERYLLGCFGEQYAAYMSRVRRWL